jgi:predicted GIY-YIG superfamily endonuclease
MANRRNGTLYTGAASNLPQRAWQHREGVVEGFTKRYNCRILVWYEVGETMDAVFSREQPIKAGSRAKKIRLIESLNPEWRDLYRDIAQG